MRDKEYAFAQGSPAERDGIAMIRQVSLLNPHSGIQAHGATEKFLVALLDSMWRRYRSRMDYVRRYEELLRQNGARFLNDHIAFRTIAFQEPSAGISSISRIFESLGYVAAACYRFPQTHLAAIHFQHPNGRFPKIFISELRSWELPAASRKIIARYLQKQRSPMSGEKLAELAALGSLQSSRIKELRTDCLRFFAERPWPTPQKTDILSINEHSQYGAWTLLHGYDVNHFTSSIDSHGVSALSDIEKTVAAMRRAGIPMKGDIEGAAGSKLRQSSTESVVIPTPMAVGRKKVAVPWTYAYFELAERPRVLDPLTGREERFEGFLGGQAAHLFEMTQHKT